MTLEIERELQASSNVEADNRTKGELRVSFSARFTVRAELSRELRTACARVRGRRAGDHTSDRRAQGQAPLQSPRPLTVRYHSDYSTVCGLKNLSKLR